MNPEHTKHEKSIKNVADKSITRRNFIHLLQCTGAGVFLGWKSVQGPVGGPHKPNGGNLLQQYKRLLPGRVVHVYDSGATSWDFSSGWYGNFVNQGVVDSMVDAGLMELTRTGSVASAWERLVPSYQPGQKFAIKVNFINYNTGGPDPDPDINTLIEPVNAIIRTLVSFGVPVGDISVYDVTSGFHTSAMPQNSFISRCLYPGVHFVYFDGNPNPYSATEYIEFNTPGSPYIPDLAICNAVIESDYLINLFIPKAHAFTGVTLGFKNHLGSVAQCYGMHVRMPYHYYYDPSYSCLLDIFRNPHFRNKTVLTIGEGLFGNWRDTESSPLRWNTFGDQAMNSMFFAADPVSIDSVCTDFIEIERIQQGYGPVINGTRDCFILAQSENMGIFEQGDPWQQPAGSGYDRIKYIYIDGV